jgi:hypothetical protein
MIQGTMFERRSWMGDPCVQLDSQDNSACVHACAAGAASRLTPKLEPLERTCTGTLRLGISTNTYDARWVVNRFVAGWQVYVCLRVRPSWHCLHLWEHACTYTHNSP